MTGMSIRDNNRIPVAKGESVMWKTCSAHKMIKKRKAMIHPVLFLIQAGGGAEVMAPRRLVMRPVVEMGQTVHQIRPMKIKRISNIGHQAPQTRVLATRPEKVSAAVRQNKVMAAKISNVNACSQRTEVFLASQRNMG